MNNLVEMYKKGAITADHLVLECLNRLDPESPELALSALPREILTRILRFADEYRGHRMVVNYGVLPTDDQATAAAEWIQQVHPDLSRGPTIVTADKPH